MTSHDEIQASIRRLSKVGKCWSPSFSPDGEQLAFVSDLTGSPQVWRVPAQGGFPEAVTAFDEQATRVIWSPQGDWLAVESAPGGGMNTQIDIVRPDGRGGRRLTSGQRSCNWLNALSQDGAYLYYASNSEQPASMDSFQASLETGAVEKIASGGGIGFIESASPQGDRFLIKRVAYRGDSNLFLVDKSTQSEKLLTPHEPPASFDNARFSHDARQVWFISNRDDDMACLYRLSLDSEAAWTKVCARDDAELVEFALSGDDEAAALVWNVAGRTELELFSLPDGASQHSVELPGEIVDSLEFSADGKLLAMCISGSRLPLDIWLLDVDALTLRQLTKSPRVGVNPEDLAGAVLHRYAAHDDLPLTGWLYEPRGVDAPYPTVLSFHGGPEAQEAPRFRYDYQALLEQGMAVFAPNVRGSSGFGKRFVNLDNGALRFDAIRDIQSAVRYLIESGIAKAGHIGIMGGSYGGYMTMAGIVEYPELFAAAANLFGIVNFKTFFEQTEPWMASISKIEYGDPDTEGDLLDALSPIYKLDRVVTPVLVLHGANDTNVPVAEAEQVVEQLRARDVPVKYVLFPDEGHGFNKEENRIVSATAIVNWFVKYLLE